jgi:hypothetical protein
MNFDFESDQGIFDNLEAITYTSVATAGNTTVSVTDAGFYRTQSGLAEGAPSQGVYVKATARFTIRGSLLTSVGGVKPADTITRTDGSVWTVLRAMPPVISGVWQIDAIDLILSNGLVQSGTIDRPDNTQDSAYRAALTNYTNVASNIPCRLQPVGGDAKDALDRRTLPQRFTAFLGQQVVTRAKDRLTVAGTMYTVLDFKLPQRIDELMTLTVEQLA